MELPHPLLVHNQFMRRADALDPESQIFNIAIALLAKLLLHLDVQGLFRFYLNILNGRVSENRVAVLPCRLLQSAIAVAPSPPVGYHFSLKAAATMDRMLIRYQR